jgi:predicted deacylase
MTRKNRTLILATLCLLVSSQITAQMHELFKVGNIEAGVGSKKSGYLVVPPGIDTGTQIPVTLIHGKREGPVLALIAGTHGYEYPGMSALHRVRQSLDPELLAGTVILVHIANPPSFRGRTIYNSPVDAKNLNRVYPGKSNGTLSERIAFVITQEVIEPADYLVDLHGGDGNEALLPYVYMPVTGIPELDRAARGMAIAFGLGHIVIDEAPMPLSGQSMYTDHTALSRGIPAITTETGQLGSNDERWIDLAETGIDNLLHHLGMLEGKQRPPGDIVWLYAYEVLRSPHTGFFRASVKPGERIRANVVIGTVLDDFGNEINVIKAPFAGIVNYVVATPPISADEPVAMISRIREE